MEGGEVRDRAGKGEHKEEVEVRKEGCDRGWFGCG